VELCRTSIEWGDVHYENRLNLAPAFHRVCILATEIDRLVTVGSVSEAVIRWKNQLL
jgi:hypothetical protein